MSALQQYIDLYDEHRKEIDAGSGAALNALRPAAREALTDKHLPGKGDEGFEKTSIDEMMAPDFGINFLRQPIEADLRSTFKCGVPNISTRLALVVNDMFVPTDTLAANLPQGVTMMSLAKACKEMPQVVEKHYGKITPLSDAGTALNTLLSQDGVLIHVARGVELDRPLQVVNIFSAPIPLAAFRRVLIVMEEGAKAQILFCDHTADPQRQYLASQVVEVFCDTRSELDLYDLEESSPLTARYSQLYAAQAEGSRLLVNGSTLTAGSTRNEYNISIDGPGCDCRLAGMVIGTGKMHVDNSSQVTHAAQRCHSNQLFKYALSDEATGAFEGSITVTPEGAFTEAYQSNRNILASPDARMHTKPQLLIFNDDVKCSHGATTGQLDQQALFYMRTRGIPLQEARTMLMQAFMVDVIDTVRLDSLRDRLRHLVDARFAGQKAMCADCPL
ncbi:MAG: Fe-S cluster assembly protein SufD [Bacteroidales bacterium]|nr:Fe-S cluster assembly protein SufD [Bacteroidales bacterium]MCD8395100.1 Fe-S cluster assembly protein SufD [Bacteroidales bacterium]